MSNPSFCTAIACMSGLDIFTASSISSGPSSSGSIYKCSQYTRTIFRVLKRHDVATSIIRKFDIHNKHKKVPFLLRLKRDTALNILPQKIIHKKWFTSARTEKICFVIQNILSRGSFMKCYSSMAASSRM